MTALNDDAPSILLQGYGFGARIWQRVRDGARSAPMRLLGDDTIFVRGAGVVELFYDQRKGARHGAMPAIVQEMLFGHGSVHSLDGDEHHHRKSTFVHVTYEDAQVARLPPHLDRERGGSNRCARGCGGHCTSGHGTATPTESCCRLEPPVSSCRTASAR